MCPPSPTHAPSSGGADVHLRDPDAVRPVEVESGPLRGQVSPDRDPHERFLHESARFASDQFLSPPDRCRVGHCDRCASDSDDLELAAEHLLRDGIEAAPVLLRNHSRYRDLRQAPAGRLVLGVRAVYERESLARAARDADLRGFESGDVALLAGDTSSSWSRSVPEAVRLIAAMSASSAAWRVRIEVEIVMMLARPRAARAPSPSREVDARAGRELALAAAALEALAVCLAVRAYARDHDGRARHEAQRPSPGKPRPER